MAYQNAATVCLELSGLTSSSSEKIYLRDSGICRQEISPNVIFSWFVFLFWEIFIGCFWNILGSISEFVYLFEIYLNIMNMRKRDL